MPFDVADQIYTLRVKKERSKTYFYGSQLAQLIATKGLRGGDMLIISFDGPQPSINIAYMGHFVEEDNESDDAMSEENEIGRASCRERVCLYV